MIDKRYTIAISEEQDNLLPIDTILKNDKCREIVYEYTMLVKDSEEDFILKYNVYSSKFMRYLDEESNLLLCERNFIYVCIYVLGEFSQFIKSEEIKSEVDYLGNTQHAIFFLYRKLADVFTFTNLEDEEDINLFNTNSSKGTEKIIMLEKLGIIDLLKNQEPFNTSINSLAKAISLITGEKLTTIQSYINPIISDGVNQKNNPLNSQKTVDKVTRKLISIGYNPLK